MRVLACLALLCASCASSQRDHVAVAYYVSPDFTEAEVATIREAAERWNEAADCALIGFTRSIQYVPGHPRALIAPLGDQELPMLGLTMVFDDGGEAYDPRHIRLGDMRVAIWIQQPVSITVVVHEMGHALGLNHKTHEDDPNTVMLAAMDLTPIAGHNDMYPSARDLRSVLDAWESQCETRRLGVSPQHQGWETIE